MAFIHFKVEQWELGLICNTILAFSAICWNGCCLTFRTYRMKNISIKLALCQREKRYFSLKFYRNFNKNLPKWSNMWSKAKNGLVQPSKQGRTSPLYLSRKREISREFARK